MVQAARRNYQIVSFDLDGTLVDTAAEIAEATNRALEAHGITRRSVAQITAHIGLGTRELLHRVMADVAAEQPGIDVLISDLGLPDGSGYDLMAELSTGRPLKGIALSGFGMEHDLAESRRAGFAAHLTKPVRIQMIVDALAEL